MPLCLFSLLSGLRKLHCEGNGCESSSFTSPRFLTLFHPLLGLPSSFYIGAGREKYEKSQLFTPGFQGQLSYLICKYEFLKSSTQVPTLGYLPYPLVAAVLLLMILVRQFKSGQTSGNFYLGKWKEWRLLQQRPRPAIFLQFHLFFLTN